MVTLETLKGFTTGAMRIWEENGWFRFSRFTRYQEELLQQRGFAPREQVDVVIRPEDVDIVPVDQGQLKGTVTNVTFKGVHYDIIVDFYGFKWLIQTTDFCPVGSYIGIKIDPDGIHVMRKSEYSGMFGDYSSYSEEYEEISDATIDPEEEDQEGGDEE